MRYGEIAKELSSIAHELNELAEKLNKIEAATPDIKMPVENAGVKKEMLSMDELTEILSISKTTASKLIMRDDFPVIRIGKRILIPRTQLIEWIGNHCGQQV